MAFPAFFLFFWLVWKIIDRETPKTEDQKLQPQNQLLIALAILAFAYTVFSYFYVWTAAAAWLGCLGLLFVIVRPPGVWDDVKVQITQRDDIAGLPYQVHVSLTLGATRTEPGKVIMVECTKG